MPVHTTCPVCNIAHLVLDSMRGKQIPCKSCQQRFVIQDGRGIKVEGPPPLPLEARAPADGALQAAMLSSPGPLAVPPVPPGAEEPATPVRTDRAPWRSENHASDSSGLVIGVIATAAVLVLAAGGAGMWFFLTPSPQAPNDLEMDSTRPHCPAAAGG